ncbi:hypothetical protein FHX74_002543 [Friedmanniella endophytica]|uniref:DUF1680 family protein n=1 Tax=Microlunatus kandeliicorticis TaxID=1759536 RepID=A0A7W3ITH7_9ACTN|nr:beta-L-arabinofuranosidase domain-containing protein [Microlunatus kandeliicorticis]MBA8794915.1 hypothetical protein [Microlunatus kandeliicorticis]
MLASHQQVGSWGRFEPGPLRDRWSRNRDYLLSLRPDNLLRPYRAEAGLWSYNGSLGTSVGEPDPDGPGTWHWGWEAPTSEVRGHILGHWISAAARIGRDEPEAAVRVDTVLAELARCQQANGGEWLGPFPRSYLDRAAAGTPVWAPQYVLHKLLAGLLDADRLGHDGALPLVRRFADWFERWTRPFSRDQLDDLLDVETGGMLEVWADLYARTGEARHRELMDRYDRPRLFDRLLAGEDVLTNKHANTQIPEILGAARAWEVTGEDRWRDVVHAFWRQAVTERGTYCTGGSTSGEVWQPPFRQTSRLAAVQEHCVVHNMMRLAETLYRWTGDAVYADHWERNLVNGVLAQQHPRTGMISYFLPLAAGSRKTWGSPTSDFWCCHGTLMQAHAWCPDAAVHLERPPSDELDRPGGGSGPVDTLRVTQYLGSTSRWSAGGTEVTVTVRNDAGHGPVGGQRQTAEASAHIQRLDVEPHPIDRPAAEVHEVVVDCATETELTLALRIPSWVSGPVRVTVDDEPVPTEPSAGFVRLRRRWRHQTVRIELPKTITTVELGGAPGTVAFLDGPQVLAGLVDEERTLVVGDGAPAAVLVADQERQHGWWSVGSYRVVGQDRGFRFVALNQVTDETYTVYFPTRP